MTYRFWIPLLLLIGCSGVRNRQEALEYDLFGHGVHSISINTNGAYGWDDLNSAYRYERGKYFSADVTIDGTSLTNIGLKQKGIHSNAFAWTDKKPLKLKFNEFEKSRFFRGLKKVNLSNAFEDPSFQRDVLSLYVLAKLGVTTPKATYSEIYFNEAYWGLYILIETVDQAFLKSRFEETQGVLFKSISGCLSQASEANGKKHFDKKGKGNSKRLKQLIKFASESSPEVFEDSISTYLKIDDFIKVMAYDLTASNEDSYIWGRCHNFYLYQHESGQFEWIPWDYNLSFGSSAEIEDWKVPNSKNMGAVLLKRVMDVEAFRKLFYQRCNEVLGVLNSKTTKRWLIANHQMIDASVARDTLAFYTYEQFSNSLKEDIAGGMASRIPGIFHCIQERTESFKMAKEKGWFSLD